MDDNNIKAVEINGAIHGECTADEIEIMFLEFLEEKGLYFAGVMCEVE